MGEVSSDESEPGRSMEKISVESSCSSGALQEVQPSKLVKDGNTSTSSSYLGSDDDDDDGPKPSELYGMYAWKIETFSQINKRELSDAFEVGGCKWYILIYPQGCEVGNHLSLFLCVASHDKLPPGWSHFAQFTLTLVNKDPKKSRYSDALHRFMEEEHDWGWKRYMELSKLSDGFIDSDTLIIKAQVQVIRERADWPFRCLDYEYWKELVGVCLTNAETIHLRFVEDRRIKLERVLADKAWWSSFSAFWLGMDQNSRYHMCREKANVILKEVVEQFFTEKEVASTLVMDSLYNGLKTLEGRGKCEKGKSKSLDTEEVAGPVVLLQEGTFVLGDNLLLLLKRAASEPLPPKDERDLRNRMKDGDTRENLIKLYERLLTVLSCKTMEMFTLVHIFSNKIMAAYQKDVALKRQEEVVPKQNS